VPFFLVPFPSFSAPGPCPCPFFPPPALLLPAREVSIFPTLFYLSPLPWGLLHTPPLFWPQFFFFLVSCFFPQGPLSGPRVKIFRYLPLPGSPVSRWFFSGDPPPSRSCLRFSPFFPSRTDAGFSVRVCLRPLSVPQHTRLTFFFFFFLSFFLHMGL